MPTDTLTVNQLVMKRKYFKTPIDRDLEVPLSQYNINELLPCLEEIEASVLGVTASRAVEFDSKQLSLWPASTPSI